MKNIKIFNNFFNILLKKENLSKNKVFFNHNSFEEIPLFSRYKNIKFLNSIKIDKHYLNLSLKTKNILLIYYSILRLEKLLKYNTDNNFIAMISIQGWEEYENREYPLEPNFWVSSNKSYILKKLNFYEKKTKKYLEISEYLKEIKKDKKFYVFNLYNKTMTSEKIFIIHKDFVNCIKLSKN